MAFGQNNLADKWVIKGFAGDNSYRSGSELVVLVLSRLRRCSCS
jgi:hypothetical protein